MMNRSGSSAHLQSIRQQLQGPSPPQEISLTGYYDVQDELDAFLAALRLCNDVRSIQLSTDFLMQMDEEEDVLRFFETVGNTPIEQLHIQSSSRFHIDIIPGESLLPLRHAPSLRLLEFQDMQVTASHQDFLLDLCRTMENHSTLETVLLHNFFANDFTNTDPDVLDVVVTTCARTMPALKTFELTGCGSQALSGRAVRLMSPEALTSLLTECQTLTKLHLSFLEFTDDHFEALVAPLAGNTTLQNLALDYHDLGSQGFKAMMLAMEDNAAIKSLSLRSLRDIELEGFAQAMLMLQYNFVVETLSVTASPSQQAEIDLYLRMNGAGRGKLRDPTVTLNEWIEILARHSDDLDVTRNLIQQVPGLCNAGTFASSERRRRSSLAGGASSSRWASSSSVTTLS
jgi:hypothetical protein